MLTMTYQEFERYAEGSTLVPFTAEIIVDMETPLSVLAKFSGEPNVFLFESIEGAERFSRYSFIGLRPRGIFTIENGRPFYAVNGTKKMLEFDGNPVNALRSVVLHEKAAHVPGCPPLFGGAIGYLGYECVEYFERLPKRKQPTATPDAAMMITDEMIVFDNLRHTLKVIVCAHLNEFPGLREAYDAVSRRAEEVIACIRKNTIRPETPKPAESYSTPQGTMTRDEFCDMVRRAKKHIQAGDVIQMVLSQSFQAPCRTDALTLYRALRLVNPSPYTFFLKLDDLTLIGSSPETMVKLENNRSGLRPIAGTRKRGSNPAQDRALADELLGDPKERAEHLMLVDLGRNDLGRTARPGSVQVPSFMAVERYSHVMHLVSDVEAILSPEFDALDLVRTTFPAGTLSGAPKVRAMELIHRFEPEPRGIYGGAVGYLSYGGDLDLAITIRTIELRDGTIHIRAGAGIVHDSDPEAEYEETLNKARALFTAVRLAENGLEYSR